MVRHVSPLALVSGSPDQGHIHEIGHTMPAPDSLRCLDLIRAIQKALARQRCRLRDIEDLGNWKSAKKITTTLLGPYLPGAKAAANLGRTERDLGIAGESAGPVVNPYVDVLAELESSGIIEALEDGFAPW